MKIVFKINFLPRDNGFRVDNEVITAINSSSRNGINFTLGIWPSKGSGVSVCTCVRVEVVGLVGGGVGGGGEKDTVGIYSLA